MNRKVFSLLAIFCVLTVVLLCGCTQTSSVAEYTASFTEDGVVYEYALTVDEKNGTFSVVRNSVPEYRYSGSFTYENGYLILRSEEKGTQYVRLVEDTFSFFDPTPQQATCTHEYVFLEEGEGTCTSRGYKKYVCSLCGAEKTENTSLGDHAYVMRSVTTGTCVKKSVTHYECKYCGATRDVEGLYGEHAWEKEKEEDNGCLVAKTVTKYCPVCKTKEVVSQEEEYGEHTYGEDGVCLYCLFDRQGLYHGRHTDKNEDGECDDCKMNVTVMTALREKGYYLDGDKLYFGAYPVYASSYDADVILAEGKRDPTTGYYRYNNASYLVMRLSRAGQMEKKAFLISYLTWTKVSSTATSSSFRCDFILEIRPFVDVTRLKNGYHADDPSIAANDWITSDLYSFANTTFLPKAFSEKQRELFFAAPYVGIPEKDLPENLYRTYCTDYAKFRTGFASDLYYTKTPSDTDPTKVWCLHGTSGDPDERSVSYGYGFVPFVILNSEIE